MATPKNFTSSSRPLSPSSVVTANPSTTFSSSPPTTSLKQTVLTELTALKDVALRLFSAIDAVADDKTTSTTSNQPLALLKKAVQIDAALQRAVDQIEAHQTYQAQISAVQQAIAVEEAAIFNVIQQLLVAKADLENVVHKAKTEKKLCDSINREPPEIETIIKVAKNLAKYTSAPPTFNPAVNDPLIVVEPPYPSELAMRAGLINQPNLGLTTGSVAQAAAPTNADADAQHVKVHRTATVHTHQEDDETCHPLFDLDLNPDLE